MEYSRVELRRITNEHKDWLENKDGGVMARFGESDLSRANLSYRTLCGADFTSANLLEANLANSDLSNAILVGADLKDAVLTNANLTGADLSGANLRGADLSGADLSGANLSGTNLSCADLTGADLKNADLRFANTINITGQRVISIQLEDMIDDGSLTYWVDLDIWTWTWERGTLEKIRKELEECYGKDGFMSKRFERAVEYILNEVKEYNDRCDEDKGLVPLITESDEEKELLELSKILKEGATKLKAYIDKITKEDEE